MGIMKGQFGWTSWAWTLALCLVGCAQVGSPSGGPKDEAPPALIEADPPVGSTEVRPSTLTLSFDEFVKAGQWRSQLLISPPIEGNVELLVKGKDIELSWEGGLRDNTTYVVQFGDGVLDVTEGNAAQDLVHAFSTGANLDSLTVRGVVKDALDGNACSGARILLFPSELPLDSILDGVDPDYVGVSRANGTFEVGYLPNHAFRLMALDDANRNYRWDAGERVALGPLSASPGDTTMHVMRMGKTLGPRSPYLSEALGDSTGFVSWKLSEPVAVGDSFSWVNQVPLTLLPREGDRVLAWGWQESMDSTALQMIWHRAPVWPKGEWLADTLDVPRPRMQSVPSFALKGKPLGEQRPGLEPELVWSGAMSSVDLSRWSVQADSVQVEPAFVASWPTTKLRLSSPTLSQPSTEVSVTLLPGAIQRAGQENELLPIDTMELVWSVQPRVSLAEWNLRLENVQCQGLLEITNVKGNRLDLVVVEQDTLLAWKLLEPGKIHATWWGDLDGNEVWDNVDIPLWRKPEPVSRMESVELRANWIIESTWSLDSTSCQTD